MALRILLGLAIHCFLASSISASDLAGRPGEIYTLGAVARAMGMGGAFAAVSDDITATYHNPAGLGSIVGRQLALQRAQLYGQTTYDYIAFGGALGEDTGAGVEVLRLCVPGGEGRDEFDRAAGSYDYGELGLGLAFASKGLVIEGLAGGLKAKALNRTLAGSRDTLFGADVGLRYVPTWLNWATGGVVLQNAVGAARGATADRLPRLLRLGLGIRLLKGALLSIDRLDSEVQVGLELPLGPLRLRAGANDVGEQTLPAYGAGLVWRGLRLDFAAQSHPLLGTTPRISIAFDIPIRERNSSKRGKHAATGQLLYLAN